MLVTTTVVEVGVDVCDATGLEPAEVCGPDEPGFDAAGCEELWITDRGGEPELSEPDDPHPVTVTLSTASAVRPRVRRTMPP